MVTIEQLKEYGADIRQGVERCMGNEAFYLRMVGLVTKDGNFEKLKDALARGDLEAGFEAAHALKGVLANLALTPVLEPVSEMTELLRTRTEMDYGPLLAKAGQEWERLQVMLQ
jgi:HPt (histidine-containing phosphotransfer) domain-containing protein